jgi:hypothetical protein
MPTISNLIVCNILLKLGLQAKLSDKHLVCEQKTSIPFRSYMLKHTKNKVYFWQKRILSLLYRFQD